MNNETTNLRQALFVVCGGAAGGALSWLFTIAGGGQLGKLTTMQAILACIFLGAGAGFIGVYVVANSDRRDLVRCLAFAVLCGFAWRVVYEGGEAMISKRQAGNEANENSAKTESLAQQVATTTAAPPPEKVTQLAAAASDSLHAAAKSDSTEVKEKAAEASTKALDVLATTTQPETANSAADSAAHIGTAAVLNDQPAVAFKAVQVLKRGTLTPAKAQALKEIESAARQKNNRDLAAAAQIH